MWGRKRAHSSSVELSYSPSVETARRVFYSFLIMFYHTCQVAVTEIHETYSSGVLPLQGLRLEGRKKKAWEAEGLEGFKVELRNEKLGRETFLGRERQLRKIERQRTSGLMKQKDNKHPVLGPHVLFVFNFSPVHFNTAQTLKQTSPSSIS